MSEMSTYEALKHEFHADPYDKWGNCMSWLFAIADRLSECGAVPDEWEYRQGMGGIDSESWEYQTLVEFDADEETLLKFGGLLWRYRGMLDAAGESY